MILAGDIGGTKTNLGCFSFKNGKPVIEIEKSFKSRSYKALEEIVKEFLSENKIIIQKACFGIAGPIINQHVETTNLPWIIDVKELKNFLDIEKISLINDLEAMAYGIFTLEEKDFFTLNIGEQNKESNSALIAAGTGLGEAVLFWDGTKHIPSASEGGHTDFGPRNTLEIQFLKYLIEKYGHVSYERIVCGPGLQNIYKFLKYLKNFSEPKWLKKLFSQRDKSAVISEIALEGKLEICVKALDMFVSIYGAEAGNLALKTLPRAGLYIGGGIAPKIIEKMKDGTFMNAFTDKGRFSGLMSKIPVKVIMNDKTGLFGSAYYAEKIMI
jgi:glucokinase